MPKALIQKWEHFFEAAVDLMLNDPFKCRITMKIKNSQNLTVIKATDNNKVLLFKCTDENDLKKIDSLFKVAAQILANVEEEAMPVQSNVAAKDTGKKKTKKRG